MTSKPEEASGNERSRPWERPARKIGADAFAALESLSSSELTSLLRAQRVRETFHRQHFRILSLCSAGRGDAFAMRTVVEHICIQLHLFSTLPPEFRRVSLRVTLAAENFDELRAMLGPEVVVDRDE